MRIVAASTFPFQLVLVLSTALAPLIAGRAQAQDFPFDRHLEWKWSADDYDGLYADVWAEGRYAYVAHFGDAGVHILDLDNPDDPVVAHYRVPEPNQFCSAQDVKTANGLLFIALESDDNDGVQIVDVRDPTNPVSLVTIHIEGYEDIHNLFYDQGYLYLADSRTKTVVIVDLATFDPDNPPPSPITEAKWILTGVGSGSGSFVHDITVKDGLLYACAWNAGLRIYDVTNVANELPTLVGQIDGDNTHAVWPTDNGDYVVTSEEKEFGGIHVYRMTQDGGTITLEETDSLVLPDLAYSTHNPLVVGYRVYCSWYQAGLQVLDIDPVTGLLTLVGSYDSSELANSGTYAGAWGVYPFNGENEVLVSDLENGFFVIGDGPPPLLFDTPEGVVEVINRQTGSEAILEIIPQASQPDPSSARIWVQAGDGPFEEVEMSDIGGDLYSGIIPPPPCGSTASYYFSVTTIEGETLVFPDDAPEEVFTAFVASSLIDYLFDDLESESGWAVGDVDDDASSGVWERVDPIGTSAQPEDDHTPAPGVFCFITGQGEPDGNTGDDDVDGGKTTLFSPIYDLGSSDALIEYARWYSNNAGSNAGEDSMLISISNDGGTNWITVEDVDENAGEWVLHEFQVSQFVEPSSTIQLRFIASDVNGGSIVEAGIDDLSITLIPCASGDFDLDGDSDFVDFGALQTCFGDSPSTDCRAAFDFDGDQAITLADYAIFNTGTTGPK